MSAASPFSVDIVPDWQGFLRCLRREGTPERVFSIELLIDEEVKAFFTMVASFSTACGSK